MMRLWGNHVSSSLDSLPFPAHLPTGLTLGRSFPDKVKGAKLSKLGVRTKGPIKVTPSSLFG